MKLFSLKSALVCVALLAGALPGFSEVRAVLVTNTNVPVDALTSAALKEIYTGRTMYWPNGQKIVIVVLAAQEDEPLNEISGMGLSQFKTFWRRMVFSGRGQEPKQAQTAAELLAQVAAIKGAIALVPEGAPLKGVKWLKVAGASAIISQPQNENGAPPPARS